MVSRVFVHIGTHKAGSTSIQRFMSAARDALATQGILYPRSGTWRDAPRGHHALAWQLRGVEAERCSGNEWSDLHAELRDWQGHSVVLSSEEFSSSDPEAIARLRLQLENRAITALVYFRNVPEYFRSLYMQQLKRGITSSSFRDFVQMNLAVVNYLGLVERWAQALGTERVRVRAFDRVKRQPGLEADFVSGFGGDYSGLAGFVRAPANVSPSPVTVPLLRAIGFVEHSAIGRNRIVRRLAGKSRQRVIGLDSKRNAGALRTAGRERLLESYPWHDLPSDLVRNHQRFLERFVEPADREHIWLRPADARPTARS